MEPPSDPRVFFAAERTLLAWIRTGLTVIGLGFVVARFGLFLRLMAREGAGPVETGSSTFLGVSFVLLGAGGIAMAVVQFVRFTRALPPHERPRDYSASWVIAFAALLAVVGVVLAVYLVVRSGV